MSALEFVVIALACYRVTRLIILDTITEPLRERTVYKIPDSGIGGWLKDLLDCPWCIGWWISVAAVACWAISPWFTWWASLPFAISTLIGFSAEKLDHFG